MKRFSGFKITTAVLFLNLLYMGYSYGCTGIRLKAEDGSVVFARTLEFAKNIHSEIVFIPRGIEYQGITQDGENGLKWKSKYAVLGANFEKQPYIIDAINEKGLSVGGFYFPNYAQYEDLSSSKPDKTINEWQFLTWIATNFETVDEVKNAISDINVCGIVFKPWGIVLPFHFMVTDAKGNSIVVEYVKGEPKIYDNPYGVITNAPTFDWHVTNIANYLDLSTTDVDEKKIAGITITPFGQGSGLFGLPGDFTPPSRFIRALFFVLSSIETRDAQETVLQAFHVLNSFDIPKGSIRSIDGKVTEYDYTQWTSAQDLKNKIYYFKTENNSRVRFVDFSKIDLDATEIKSFTMETISDDFLDVTTELK